MIDGQKTIKQTPLHTDKHACICVHIKLLEQSLFSLLFMAFPPFVCTEHILTENALISEAMRHFFYDHPPRDVMF